MPRYIELQGEGKLHLFWPSLHEAWFREFAEEPRLGLPTPGAGGDTVPLTATQLVDLGAAITTRKGRLDNWFRNQRAKMIKVGSVVTPSVSSDSSLAGVLFAPGGPKRHRRHQAIEVYQKQHPERIRDALQVAGYNQLNEEHMSAGTDLDEAGQSARIKATKVLRMRMRTRIIKEMWGGESEQERERCAVLAEREEVEAVPTRTEGERTPAEYQAAIDELDAVMVKVHGAVDSMAGWKGFTVVGGPQPKFGGSMSLKITCFGVSSGGNNFRQSHPTWEDSVARPFQDWLKRVYPADVRKARALVEETGTPTDAAAPDEAAEADEPEQAPPQAAKAKKSKRTRRKTAPGNAGTAATPVLPAAAEAASDASGLGSDTLVPPPTDSATPLPQLHASDTPPSHERSLLEQVAVWEAMLGPYDAGASGDFRRDGSGYSSSVGDLSDMEPMGGSDMDGDMGGNMGGGNMANDMGGDMGGGDMDGMGGWDEEAPTTPSWATTFDPLLTLEPHIAANDTVSTPVAISSAGQSVYRPSDLFLAFEKTSNAGSSIASNAGWPARAETTFNFPTNDPGIPAGPATFGQASRTGGSGTPARIDFSRQWSENRGGVAKDVVLSVLAGFETASSIAGTSSTVPPTSPTISTTASSMAVSTIATTSSTIDIAHSAPPLAFTTNTTSSTMPPPVTTTSAAAATESSTADVVRSALLLASTTNTTSSTMPPLVTTTSTATESSTADVVRSALLLTSTTDTTSSTMPPPVAATAATATSTAGVAASAPLLPPQSRPMAKWPAPSFSGSPKPVRKAAGKKPAEKAQGKKKKSEKAGDVNTPAGSSTTVGDALPPPLVYTTTNNNRRINNEADARMAKRKAVEKKQKMLLHNPDGPTPLVVLPRARRARAQADGTEVKLPKRHTRKELEIMRLEAAMTARGVAAQAERDVAAAKTGTKRKAVDAGTSGAVKKRKV
ncbi:hypothetical protein C8J57DRAFT_1517382 [Mycena rebaudengoi]|nr:hypothetical protein C8J57DRAFT_1517382 [Mycena rebaudengoi]